MKYVCFVLYLQISFKECTIDTNKQELVYIANHLTATECRRLFASLNFPSYDLPATLSDVEHKVPKDIPCVKLLIKWNSGEETWEGKGKTHALIERRLRQLGKKDLADWLGKFVFHQLAEHINKSLEIEPYFEEDKPEVRRKFFEDKDSRFSNEPWSTIDSILSFTLFGLLFMTLVASCRMLKLTFRRANVKRNDCKDAEELNVLMSADSVDSDQETVYELNMENRKRSHVKFEDEKPTREESDK